jgi:hypothetical protein
MATNFSANSYDSGKYGVITRTWFGLTDKHGGGYTSAYTKGSATCVAKLARFYPRGPISIRKIGMRVLATISTPATNASCDGFYYRLYKEGVVAATDMVLADDTNRVALYGVASKAVNVNVTAGSYITIKTSSSYTGDGTVDAGSINGSFAFFIDWVPKYSSKNDLS